MKLFDDTVPVLLFVMIRTRVAVVHAIAHRVIKQNSDLARRRSHGLGVTNSAGKAPVECAKRAIASSNGHCRKPECDCDAAAGFARV